MRFSNTRRTLLGFLAAAPLLAATPALAAGGNPAAEAFVADNIVKGLAILNNKSLSTEQRRSQFESLLLSLVDVNRIANFALGNYRRTASPADLQAFDDAFRDYAVATYQFYFSKYNGQTLKVAGSTALSADDTVVTTHMIDPNDHSGQPPVEVDFRIRTNTGRPVLIDVGAAGIWLSLSQRDMVVSVLGNNGDIAALCAQLRQKAEDMRKGA